MRQFFLNFILFFAFLAHARLPVLGPNIEYGMLGAVAPAGLRGAFIPQANANFDFAWIEPLGDNGYGVWEPNKTNYIKFLVGTELSPFYGTVRIGMGFAPLPPPFSIIELRFVYANENLFFTDVEMAMKTGDNPSIYESWNAGYIFDHFYNKSSYAQVQSFDTQLGGKYFSERIDIALWLHFILIDINSSYDKKSFDYMRGIPLYGRDYLAISNVNAVYRINNGFAWDLDFLAMYSGRQLDFSAPLKNYGKEPLSYNAMLTGPLWTFNENKSCFSLKAGFFTRDSQDNAFSDSVNERILLSIQYKHFWDLRFGKK